MLFGWDISTSVIGVTVLTDEGKWVKTSHFDFAKMAKGAKSLHDKMDECEWWIEEILGPYLTGSHTHYFEDKLGNFAFGKTQMQTLMKLAAFNTLFSYMVRKKHLNIANYEAGGIGVTTHHIHPSTVKAIMRKEGLEIPKGSNKKLLTLEYVKKRIPDHDFEMNRNNNPKPFCFDEADSYIVARAGFLRKYLIPDAKGKKASSDKTGSGTRAHHKG